MDVTEILIGVTTTIVLYYLFNQDERWKKLGKIPGPALWPIIGNWHFFDRRPPWIKTWHLADKYGPVMRLQIGTLSVVMLNTHEAIYDALVNKIKKLLTRPKLPRIDIAMKNGHGIVFSQSNDQWRTLRRAFLQNFKYYGGGKSHLEPIILEVLEDYIKSLKQTNGKAHDPKPEILNYFASIMFVTDSGKKPGHGDVDLVSVFDKELMRHLNPFGNGVELDAFPWYRYLGLGKQPAAALEKVATNRKKLWENTVKHIEVNPEYEAFTYEEGKIREPCFAATLKKLLDQKGDHGFVQQHGEGALSDTFSGGLSTSTHGLHFFYNILLNYPAIQDKLHAEVDELLGDNYEAIVTTDDKDKLPYHMATLHELMRYVSILPFGLPHFTEEEVEIEGHVIPKGVIVMMNTWYLHHDSHWKDPFEFRPERFIDDDGQFVSADHPNRRHMLAFGAGIRVCAGMVMALNRYFLTMSNVMRHIAVAPDPVAGITPCDPRGGKPGMFVHGPDYSIRFIARRP